MVSRSILSGALLCSLLVAASLADSKSTVGTKVDDFTLADAYGKQHSLAELGERPIVVLALLGTECPLARLYAPRLNALAAKYETLGVAFLGIDSNSQDNVTELKNFARTHGLTFPLLKDLNNALADRLQAERTPCVYVLDRERVVRYQGRIDDQYGIQATASGGTGQLSTSQAAPTRSGDGPG